jgi:multiple sugar transport system ATP-binding protein
MASLTLSGINKLFGTFNAVKDVNLSVADREFIALLGPSGCGKTTTLRMIAGLEQPNSGTIQIGTRDVTHLSPRERDIAMVFQDYALYPHMTVLENVGYPLKVRGVSMAELRGRVGVVAKQLQIDGLLDRRPAQLSGGQQQRVALARAVVHQAQVTLYDEPLSNLDTKLRLDARAFLKHLQRAVGVTSIYVTHDQAEAMGLADRIVVMNAGRVMQVGTPMDIYRRPANTFVAAFIGNPPMNLIPCRVDTTQRVIGFETGETIPLPLAQTNFSSPEQSLTLGIRPEHIIIHNQFVEGTIAGRLYVTQMLGSEILYLIYVGEHLISVRVITDDSIEVPEHVWLELRPEHIFFYDSNGDLRV